MSKQELTIYLNDHLAGSVGALELIDNLIDTYREKPLGQFFKDLRNEIDTDQSTLKKLIERLGEKESSVRKAGAWVAEKLSRSKIRLSDSEEGKMGLLHALESLALGITGKRGLWTALSAAADNQPRLRELDYAMLEERAIEQFDRVEAKRIEIAREVLVSD
jgi:DNA-binding MarR family transcriptional regulator